MVQYMEEYGQNITASKRKPVAKCSNKQEIYHHPNSSTIHLEKRTRKDTLISSPAQLFYRLNRITLHHNTKLTFQTKIWFLKRQFSTFKIRQKNRFELSYLFPNPTTYRQVIKSKTKLQDYFPILL